MYKHTIHLKNKKKMSASPLGKKSSYISQYTVGLLFAIPRQGKNNDISVPERLSFHGFDTWNAYEVSWLNSNGKPIVAIVQFDIPCSSKNIIESKSFKLYLNSLSNTKFDSTQDVKSLLEKDICQVVEGKVDVKMFSLDDLFGQKIEKFSGECLDDTEVTCDTYIINPDYLSSNANDIADEILFSNLLKCNCLVTGQPDWGSVQIKYNGPKINRMALLKYIVSFRDHHESHKLCVERVVEIIFKDILERCKPNMLTVEARFTRRGGLDINPIRSTEAILPAANIRMSRQ